MILRLSLFRPETMAFFGYLALTAGAAKMFAPRQGIISIFHIEEGQRTHAGQPLLTITIDQTTADGETARSMTWTARSPVGRNKGCWREYFISDRKFSFLTKEQSISMSIGRDKSTKARRASQSLGPSVTRRSEAIGIADQAFMMRND